MKTTNKGKKCLLKAIGEEKETLDITIKIDKGILFTRISYIEDATGIVIKKMKVLNTSWNTINISEVKLTITHTFE